MPDKFILRHKRSGQWVVRVKGHNRDIDLCMVDQSQDPDPAHCTPEVQVEKSKTIVSGRSGYYIQLNVDWYEIPLINEPQLKNFKIKIDIDNGIAQVKEKSGGNWSQWVNPTLIPQRPTPPTDIEVEVCSENPRWVKIGGRWYYIG